MLVRDYLKAEAEKDERTHGFLEGALRMGVAEKVEPRFNECLKLTLPDLTNAEFQAVSACGGIIASVQNQEIRQGYQAQMLDEIRHTQLEMALREYYVRHSPRPGGLGHLAEGDSSAPGRPRLDRRVPALQHRRSDRLRRRSQRHHRDRVHQHPAGGRAADRGDERRPRARHDVPVDSVGRSAPHGQRLRHAARGAERPSQRPQDQRGARAPLLARAQGARRARRLADGIRRARPAVGLQGPMAGVGGRRLRRRLPRSAHRVRRAAAARGWRRRRATSTGWCTRSGSSFAAMWPLNFWRSDAMDARDAEWFEKHYPGWNGVYGGLWDTHRQLADPADGRAAACRNCRRCRRSARCASSRA